MSMFAISGTYQEMIERVRVLAAEHRHMRNLLIQSRTRETVLAGTVSNLKIASNAKQAKIDALMIEYCPSEMSDEQRSEWAKHQRPAQPQHSEQKP